MSKNRFALFCRRCLVAGLACSLLSTIGGCGSGSGGDEASVTEPIADTAVDAGEPFCLELESARDSVLLGEPLTLLVSLRNCSTGSLEVRDLLRPEYGLLSVRIGHPQFDQERPYNPPLRRDGRGAGYVELAAGEALSEVVPVYFGRDGWQLSAPGSYTFQADYSVDELSLTSNVLAVDVEIPQREADLAAAQAFMSPGAVTFYFLGGGDEQGADELGALVTALPDSPWAAYANLGLAMNAAGDMESAARTDACEQVESSLAQIDQDWVIALRGFEALSNCLRDNSLESELPRVTADFLNRHPHAGSVLQLE